MFFKIKEIFELLLVLNVRFKILVVWYEHFCNFSLSRPTGGLQGVLRGLFLKEGGRDLDR